MKLFVGLWLQSLDLVELINTSICLWVKRGPCTALRHCLWKNPTAEDKTVFSTVENKLEVERLIKHCLKVASDKCAFLFVYIILSM